MKPFHSAFFKNNLIHDRDNFKANSETISYLTAILSQTSAHLIEQHYDPSDQDYFLDTVEADFSELHDLENITNQVQLQLELTQNLLLAKYSNISPIRSIVESGAFLIEHLPYYNNGLYPALSICINCLDELYSDKNDIKRLISIGKLSSLVELVHTSSAILWQIPEIRLKVEKAKITKQSFSYQIVDFFIQQIEVQIKEQENSVKRGCTKNNVSQRLNLTDLFAKAQIYYYKILDDALKLETTDSATDIREHLEIADNDKWLRRMLNHAQQMVKIKNLLPQNM